MKGRSTDEWLQPRPWAGNGEEPAGGAARVTETLRNRREAKPEIRDCGVKGFQFHSHSKGEKLPREKKAGGQTGRIHRPLKSRQHMS